MNANERAYELVKGWRAKQPGDCYVAAGILSPYDTALMEMIAGAIKDAKTEERAACVEVMEDFAGGLEAELEKMEDDPRANQPIFTLMTLFSMSINYVDAAAKKLRGEKAGRGEGDASGRGGRHL